MFKNLLLSLCVILFLAACKKESKPVAPVTYDVVGKWSLYSWRSTSPDSLNVNADQYPCIADNVLTLNTDGTSSLSYIGIGNCVVTPATTGVTPTYIGMKGQLTTMSTWNIDGNKLYMASNEKNPGTITNLNGKLRLTLIDTVIYNSIKYTVTTVDIKQ